MSLSKLTTNLNNISGLADKPSLTSSDLKSRFDKAGNDIKNYINNILTTEIDSAISSANASIASANAKIDSIQSNIDTGNTGDTGSKKGLSFQLIGTIS